MRLSGYLGSQNGAVIKQSEWPMDTVATRKMDTKIKEFIQTICIV